MPTSVGPNSPDRRHQAGFTLVELMVVLAVMGLLAGVAVWRWPAGNGRVRADAVAFSSRVAAARDQAILSGRPLALEIDAAGYRFVQRGQQGWQPVAEPALRERRWSRGVRPAGAAGPSARLGFDSVGLPDRALDLTLAGTNAKAVVEIAADGEVSVR
jgi:general secretion pathway protein H